MAEGGAAQMMLSATAPPSAFFQIQLPEPDGKTGIPAPRHT